MTADDRHSHTHSPRRTPPETLVGRLREHMGGRTPAFFLDFDGTLAPIVDRPEYARLPEATRAVLRSLSERYVVCVISGRGLHDVRDKTGLPYLFYAADHGRRIEGPPGSDVSLEVGGEAKSSLRKAARQLEDVLGHVSGVIVERKDLSLSVHYRLAPHNLHEQVAAEVARVAALHPRLALRSGKLVHELRPGDDWDKGRAVLWLMERLGLTFAAHCPVCIGDDLTDEDMFRAVGGRGVTVFVGDGNARTAALFRVQDVHEASVLLASFVPRAG